MSTIDVKKNAKNFTCLCEM